MTPTLTTLSPLLSAAPTAMKAPDGNGAAPESSAFARELNRAQGAEARPAQAGKPAATGPAGAAQRGKPGGPGHAAADRADGSPAGSDATGSARPTDSGGADAAEADADADSTLPADLASMINGVLGLPAAPATPPAAAADAAAGAAAGAAGADGSAAMLAGAGKDAAGNATRTLPAAAMGAGVDGREGRDGRAGRVDGSPRGAAANTPTTTDLQSAAADARANVSASASADGRGPLPAAAETPTRQAAEPSPLPSPALPATAGLANPAAPTSIGAAVQTPFEARLSAALGSLDFAPAFGQQVRVLVQDGVQHARLHLNPADMGPITVQIALDGSAAQVHLAAEQPLTRQALEQAMPVLASALREGGLTLSGGGVFEQPREPQRDGSGSPAGANGRRDDTRPDDIGMGTPAGMATRRLRGAVDLIA